MLDEDAVLVRTVIEFTDNTGRRTKVTSQRAIPSAERLAATHDAVATVADLTMLEALSGYRELRHPRR